MAVPRRVRVDPIRKSPKEERIGRGTMIKESRKNEEREGRGRMTPVPDRKDKQSEVIIRTTVPDDGEENEL